MSKDLETLTPVAGKSGGQLIELDPYLIAFSLDNPRKRRGLDIDSLNALAASIKAQGLAQPILVRPLPGSRAADTFSDREDGRPLPTHELVCGERRLRASRIAELDVIPVLSRDLSDEQALELQLVENIEREDLDPMEEAEGFELLRNKLGYSIEQIAERIGQGKGKSYVYKTMKLLELTPESREAMYDGHLGRSTGLLVARYPAGQQKAVVSFIKGMANSGEPASYRAVSPAVFRRFNLELGTAVWTITDADLVPAAGACNTCPKRTGAHADLFADEADSPDSCTDPDCFESKRAAHVEQVKAKAAKDGFKVIDGDEARAAMPSPYGRYIDGYTRLTSTAYTVTGDDGNERQVTYEDALRAQGKKAPKPRILINPHTGEAIKVITDELADKLIPPDDDQPKGKVGRSLEPEIDQRPEDHQALDNQDVRRAVLLRMFDAIRNRDRTNADMLLIGKALFSMMYSAGDSLEGTEDYLNWDFADIDYDDQSKAAADRLDAMPASEVAMAITIAAAEIALRYNSGFTREQEVALATSYGVDVLAVRDKVAEDLERADATADAPGDDDEPAGTEEDEVVAGADQVDEGAEPEPTAGARVRMKEDLRSPGGKFRKISGREGVLLQQLEDGDWMFRSDGGKDKARVKRDEFNVLAGEADDSAAGGAGVDGDGVESAKWPLPAANAAWPFPPSKQ